MHGRRGGAISRNLWLAYVGLAITTVGGRLPSSVHGAIIGEAGNRQVSDPGWPDGTAAIFNHPSRIAWWEGPPFGGGNWHAEYRGDAATLSKILAAFAQLEIKSKHVVLHDGRGSSFWLNPNHDDAKRDDAAMDWSLSVWVPSRWQRLVRMPVDISPAGERGPVSDPPAQIDVYVDGNVTWSDVVVPDGLPIVDERLESHGFQQADATVLEGRITDLANGQSLAGHVTLQEIQPQSAGGYQYPTVADTTADNQGHWVIRQVRRGWYRIVFEAPQYAPRVAGYVRIDDEPRWLGIDAGLVHSAELRGLVTDAGGQPLQDAQVRLANVASETGSRYESPSGYVAATDEEGHFQFSNVPRGTATVSLFKAGYCQTGLGPSVSLPGAALELSLIRAASLVITVEQLDEAAQQSYLVQVLPEGGEAVGKWSGSTSVDAQGQARFENIPPGVYVVQGQPNPSSADERSESVRVELIGGQATTLMLSAKPEGN